jgi:hypothetical protein
LGQKNTDLDVEKYSPVESYANRYARRMKINSKSPEVVNQFRARFGTRSPVRNESKSPGFTAEKRSRYGIENVLKREEESQMRRSIDRKKINFNSKSNQYSFNSILNFVRNIEQKQGRRGGQNS